MGYTVHVQFVPPDKLTLQKIKEEDAARVKRFLAQKGIDSEIIRFPAQHRVHLRVRLPVSDEGWSTYAIVRVGETDSGLSISFSSLKNRLAYTLEMAWKSIGTNTVAAQISEFKKSLTIVLEE